MDESREKSDNWISYRRRSKLERKTKGNGARRAFVGDCTSDTVVSEEELDTWSPRSSCPRPSVALQMKTLNNLVAGCKSRREATLIDTYRCVPRAVLYSSPTFMNARYESPDNNIVSTKTRLKSILESRLDVPTFSFFRSTHNPPPPQNCLFVEKFLSRTERRKETKPIRLTKSGPLPSSTEPNPTRDRA